MGFKIIFVSKFIEIGYLIDIFNAIFIKFLNIKNELT